MTVELPQDISGLLVAWSKGDEEALSQLMAVVYPELRRIARQHLRGRPAGHTLESAALAKLRDTLLPKLMSGEIQVRDAELVVEGAT